MNGDEGQVRETTGERTSGPPPGPVTPSTSQRVLPTSTAGVVLIATAVLLAVVAVVAAQVWQVGQPPLPGRIENSPLTGFIAGPLELLAALAALGTVGSLLAAAWGYRRPARGQAWKLTDREYAVLGQARRWALLWAISAIVLIPVNAADTNGVPLGYLAGSLGDFLASTQTSQAWLLTAAVALAVALGCWLSTTWRWTIGMVVLAVLASLPTVVTAQVSVGAGHDLATDGAIFFTLAVTLWFGAVWATPATARSIGAAAAQRRTLRIGAVAVGVAIIARLGIGAFEMAGQSLLDWGYGIGLIASMIILVLLAVRLVLRWRRVSGSSAAVDGRLLIGNAVDLSLVVVFLGVQTALLRLVPPRFLVRQTPTENYLGYNLPDPPRVTEALLPGRPNLLLLITSATMIGLYLWGVLRLHRNGDRWPISRTICWIVGWLLVVILIGSRMWTYSSATFSWHMVVHMTLNMGAPALLVLGGPLTLVLRTTQRHGAGAAVGLHDVVSTVLNWRLVQFLLHPILVWVFFVGSLYVLYFSPLFGIAMRYHWAHQLMAVHFLIIGYLFYWLVIGVDRPPRSLPHIAKLGYIFAAMPFHAFFAVAVLSGGAIIGENFYVSLDLPWLTDLAAQQRAGGQVTWATGEIPLFIVIIALVAQWFAQDQREARRKDRAADSGHDDSLAAYNEMLAALAARDRAQQDQERTRVDHDRASGGGAS
ncbi:cytochrome c oxidase assembly protein [Microlunatus soli]|uniref:Putative copper resistance protein D n=1 Tax=Microlunatus soli TaxID=630515 RepID=A0A1H1T4X1_9ACTN|nr:cytochrome c oxidase assembly protein [Microlunatus soli]SDS54719.1 putative copper resistance protein D [Microlunatus soli]